MAVTTDIARMYRAPRQVVRDQLSMGQREDRVFAYLMIGCLLIFVGQWPRLSRVAYLDGVPLERLVAYEFLAWMIVWPLAFYLIASILFAGRKVIGGIGTAYDARLALFWGFLAAAPLGLLNGLVSAFFGAGLQSSIVGALWLLTFGIFVFVGMRTSGGK